MCKLKVSLYEKMLVSVENIARDSGKIVIIPELQNQLNMKYGAESAFVLSFLLVFLMLANFNGFLSIV